MQASETRHETGRVAAERIDDRFAANDVRLAPRQWWLAALVIAVIFWSVPRVWEKLEPLEISADYRIPYRLGYDYWSFERTCRQVCRSDATVLIGDSVVWGHYVGTQATLSHHLHVAIGTHEFANLGVDGTHPVALYGLVQHYGQAIRNRPVIVNCNLLWISSPRYDLSSDKETQVSHPALVPQFACRIPSYRATSSQRSAIVAARHIEFLQWADHLRIAYFGNDDLATWTLENPYESPLRPLTCELPSPDEPPSPLPDARPWTEKNMRRISPPWVPLDESLQWRFFRQTMELLTQRGNHVFVIVGPLNEHMLTAEGLRGYTERKHAVDQWLSQNAIPHAVPAGLPSAAYADLSHPTADGYALLARQLATDPDFQAFLATGGASPAR
jgi:hypothetical protein